MDTEQRQMIERLRRRLEGRAWLSEDAGSYRRGVDEAFDEIEVVLDEPTPATRRLTSPTS